MSLPMPGAYCAGWQFYTPVDQEWVPVGDGQALIFPQFQFQIRPLPGTADQEKSSGRNTVADGGAEAGGGGGPPVVSQAASPTRAAARTRRRSSGMARDYATPCAYAKG